MNNDTENPAPRDLNNRSTEMTKEELSRILASHALWLAGYPEGVRANLAGANLAGAELTNAILFRAKLADADLRGADLRDADLRDADLRGANLTDVDLRGANLRRANLTGADLRGANLTGADLRYVDLREADLRGANLTGASLFGAKMAGAKLHGATLPDYLVLPSTGGFIAYKQVEGAVLTLFVPRDALRTSCLRSRKCRVSKAKVIASTSEGEEWRSTYNPDFIYRLGEWVEPDGYDDDIRHECTQGIHVFATRKEAVEY